MPHPDDSDDRPHDDAGRRPRDGDFDDRPRRRPPRKRMGTGAMLAIVGGIVLVCGGCLVGGGLYGVVSVRDAANRLKSSNNLKQIGLACHNYNDVYGELPSNTYTEAGKPLLSWRVQLLPFLGYDYLYRQFKLDEPWDSPNNKALLASMPDQFVVPSTRGKTPAGFTHYRGFSSPGAVFDRRRVPGQGAPANGALPIALVKDGTDRTILVVEAADPVEWTRPDDLDASPGKPFPKLGGFYRGGKSQVLMVNGTVRQLRPDLPADTLRALITHSGGEPLPPGWDDSP